MDLNDHVFSRQKTASALKAFWNLQEQQHEYHRNKRKALPAWWIPPKASFKSYIRLLSRACVHTRLVWKARNVPGSS